MAFTNITQGCDPLDGGDSGAGAGAGAGATGAGGNSKLRGRPCNVGHRGVIRTRFAFGGTAGEDVTLYALLKV